MLEILKSKAFRFAGLLILAINTYSNIETGTAVAGRVLTFASHWREAMDRFWSRAFGLIGLDVHPKLYPSLSMAVFVTLVALAARYGATEEDMAEWRREGAMSQMHKTIVPVLLLVVLNNLATFSYEGQLIASPVVATLHGLAKTLITLYLLPAMTFLAPGKLTSKLVYESLMVVAAFLVGGYALKMIAPAVVGG